MGRVKVESLMSRQVVTCGAGDALDVPARRMWDADVGIVPVVDDKGRLVGVVTDRDVAMAAAIEGKPLSALRVRDTMARDVATVRSDDLVRTAEAVMAERRVRRLPVVDSERRVVGLISLNDVAGSYSDREGIGASAPEIARTLRAISHHREVAALPQPVDYHTIVIGSGIGGLAAGLAVARTGEKVLVVERSDRAGGWCHAFEREGHRFDTGVHYVGQLHSEGRLRRVIEGLGLGRELVFCEMQPDAIDQVLLNGERYPIPRGANRIADALAERFPADARGIRAVVDILVDVARGVSALEPPDRDLGAVIRATPSLARWGARSLSALLDHYIADPRAKTVLAARCGDHGVPPARASVALHAMVSTHYFDGGWYPMGGSQAIVDAFVGGIERHGGDVRTDAEVTSILVERAAGARRAIGVRLADGTELRARNVISDADPAITYGKLLDRADAGEGIHRKLARTAWSPSTMALYAVARLDPQRDGLGSGNLWGFERPDVDALFDPSRSSTRTSHATFPGFFLTIQSLKDPTQAQDGVHTLGAFAFTPWEPFSTWEHVPPGERPRAYHQMKRELGDRLLESVCAAIPDLRARLVFHEVATPLSNRSWVNATRGNAFGVDKRLSQLGPFGFGPTTPIERLFLCGASTGAMGVLGAASTGLRAAATVLGTAVEDLLTPDGPFLRTVPADDVDAWPEGLKRRVAAA